MHAHFLREPCQTELWSGTHGTTFGGSPLACALGHHVLNRLAKLDGIADSSGYLIARLELLAKWFPDIVEAKVRGRGLILGLGFYEQGDPERVMKLARERGLFVLTAGKDALRLVPSLNVQREHVDMAVDVLEGCLAVLQREKSGTTPA